MDSIRDTLRRRSRGPLIRPPGDNPGDNGARLGALASLATGWCRSVISISITPEAFEAIRATLPRSDPPPLRFPGGFIRIWLDRSVVDGLTAVRGPGESYSDVILRLAKAGS